MLDKKSMAILKSLNKLSFGCTYKVVTVDEIVQNLSTKNIYDQENIKQIMDFLSKQEYINIKFSEEDTFCYSLLPKARIYLEQGNLQNNKRKKTYLSFWCYVLVVISAFLGSALALAFFIYCL